jgi:MarR family 2-MHQ and catechol resistance regulon transcriptional repressor
MPDFHMHDGLLVEGSAQRLARTMAKRTGGDPLSYEAHFTLVRAYNTITGVSRRVNPSRLSLGRYNVLRLLYLADNRRLLMSEISEAMEVSATVITRLVDTLAESGLVERTGHDTDKRKTWATMTEAGAALFEEEWPAMANMVQDLWEGFREDEKRLLVHLLTKLRVNLLSLEAIEDFAVAGTT